MKHRYVVLLDNYEQVYLYDNSGKKVRQVLWGDWLWIEEPLNQDPDWYIVLWAWKDEKKKQRLKIPKRHATKKRPLEIIFVDVGQGDGAVLITPERDDSERIVVIDAGEGDHMFNFLESRFFTYRNGFNFDAAVITHPDKDHYYGFHRIFNCVNDDNCKKVTFDKLYHSGIVEYPDGDGWDKLGGKVRDESMRKSYLENLVVDDESMRKIFTDCSVKNRFPKTISSAIKKNLIGEFQMLSTSHGAIEKDVNGKIIANRRWMPDFAPSDNRDYEIEVLGPFVEHNDKGDCRLRVFNSLSKTKNGHSVLLKLKYGEFSVLFGGDLNVPAEKFLLTKYANIERWPNEKENRKREVMVEKAREVFQCDVMKACHHGSSDVTDEFLRAVNPAAFVISSGDKEGHVHPRPDLLGRLGRCGRGDSPVLLSTELQRSTREQEDIRVVNRLRRNINFQVKKVSAKRGKQIDADITTLGRSNVDVDGAIYLKTDGKRLITAFKKETNSEKDKWFYFEYEVKNGELLLLKK